MKTTKKNIARNIANQMKDLTARSLRYEVSHEEVVKENLRLWSEANADAAIRRLVNKFLHE